MFSIIIFLIIVLIIIYYIQYVIELIEASKDNSYLFNTYTDILLWLIPFSLWAYAIWEILQGLKRNLND